MKKSYLIVSAVFSIFLMFSAMQAQTANDNQNSIINYQVGELVEAADYRGSWYRSKITGYDDSNGKYHVHFFGWSDSWDEWVTTDRIRYADDAEFGAEVEVTEDGIWYPAVIADSRYNREHLVIYTNNSGEQKEEWVLNDRLRGIGEGNYRYYGREVEVLYGNKWVRAQILKRRPGEVYVHYDGESDTWNAWIDANKVRRIR